ncbi:hypothetical protein ABVT39_017303 [Epinephelus coioides]
MAPYFEVQQQQQEQADKDQESIRSISDVLVQAVQCFQKGRHMQSKPFQGNRATTIAHPYLPHHLSLTTHTGLPPTANEHPPTTNIHLPLPSTHSPPTTNIHLPQPSIHRICLSYHY